MLLASPAVSTPLVPSSKTRAARRKWSQHWAHATKGEKIVELLAYPLVVILVTSAFTYLVHRLLDHTAPQLEIVLVTKSSPATPLRLRVYIKNSGTEVSAITALELQVAQRDCPNNIAGRIPSQRSAISTNNGPTTRITITKELTLHANDAGDYDVDLDAKHGKSAPCLGVPLTVHVGIVHDGYDTPVPSRQALYIIFT